MLEVSFFKSQSEDNVESDLKLLFSLLKVTPTFDQLKIEVSSITLKTFVYLVK